MSSKVVEMICCSILVGVIVTMCDARPPQGFEDTAAAQVASEIDTPDRNLIDRGDGLTSLQLQLLAQQLSDYNTLQQFPRLPDRIIMNKRQQRYRQCYFNPISCFRK